MMLLKKKNNVRINKFSAKYIFQRLDKAMLLMIFSRVPIPSQSKSR